MRDPRTTGADARLPETRAPFNRPAHKSSRNLVFCARAREAIDIRFTRSVQLMRTRHRRA